MEDRGQACRTRNRRSDEGAWGFVPMRGGEELGPRDFFPDFHVVSSKLQLDNLEPTAEQLVPYLAMLRGAMEQALQQYGSIRLAAASLGMPKSTFADRAKQWGLLTRQKPRMPRKT